METLPARNERIGYDKCVEDNVLKDALMDLALFSINTKKGESILQRWLKEYNSSRLFRGYINEVSREKRSKRKQKALSMVIKENRKGGDKRLDSDIYCLSVFNKKRRTKKIRRRIIL